MHKLITSALIVSLGWTAAAFAGPKPNPEPVYQSPQREPDIALWQEAYRQAHEPRLLVLVGVEARQSPQSAGPTATGTIDRGRYVGHSLSLFEPTGDALKLKGDLEEVLLLNRDVELIDIDALAERDRRELELLGLHDGDRAMRLLGRKLNADVALVIRMVTGEPVYERDAIYRVAVDLIEIGRGRKIGGFAFDWLGDVDSASIKRYAHQVARKSIEQFADRYLQPQSDQVAPIRYTLRLLGLENAAQLKTTIDAIAGAPGVSKAEGRDFSSDGRESVATVTLQYTGRPLDLLHELQEALRGALDLRVDGVEAMTGALTLIVRGR